MRFHGRIAAPLERSPGRWLSYSKYISFIAEHFNDDPYYAAPLAPWAPGGRPLDAGAARQARRFSERCFRMRLRFERKQIAAKARAEREREQIREKAARLQVERAAGIQRHNERCERLAREEREAFERAARARIAAMK